MWLMTPEGFYSVIEWRNRWSKDDPHDGLLCVRTRSRGDLNRLRKWVPELGETVVTPKGDYRYRAWVDRESLAVGVMTMVGSIDYRNFKDEVARHDPKRARLYHRVWSILGDIQKDGPYGWFRRKHRREPDPDPQLFELERDDLGWDIKDDVAPLIRTAFDGVEEVRGHFRGKTWVRPYVRRLPT